METVIDAPTEPQVLGPTRAHQLVERQAGALAMLDPGALLQIAVERGDGIEVLAKLMDLKDRFDAKMALQEFNAAFARFKASNVQVLRNKLIADGPLKGKKHAELADICDAATEALSACGLSASWRVVSDERDWIRVACRVKHAAGHFEEVEFGGPIDTGPGRNPIQARKSSVTYLERITMLLALGLAEHDADDDGAGGATVGAEAQMMTRLIGEVQQTTNDEAAAAHWKANSQALLGWPYGFEKYKAAVVAHRTAMKGAAT